MVNIGLIIWGVIFFLFIVASVAIIITRWKGSIFGGLASENDGEGEVYDDGQASFLHIDDAGRRYRVHHLEPGDVTEVNVDRASGIYQGGNVLPATVLVAVPYSSSSSPPGDAANGAFTYDEGPYYYTPAFNTLTGASTEVPHDRDASDPHASSTHHHHHHIHNGAFSAEINPLATSPIITRVNIPIEQGPAVDLEGSSSSLVYGRASYLSRGSSFVEKDLETSSTAGVN